MKKEDELGMFHFGGSSHCLFFRTEQILNLIYMAISHDLIQKTVLLSQVFQCSNK